jgi:hypothetical protein
MGWTFRKTISLGPLRITFSKSGVSFSFGAKDVHAGVNARGHRTTSINIPGTGISYRKTKSKKKEEDAEE